MSILATSWFVLGAAFAQVPLEADDPPLDQELLESYGTPAELGIGRYVALMIAAEDYGPGSGIPDLATPTRDVAQIGGVLEEQYGFEVRTLLNATRADIIGALDDLSRELSADDALIVYYAGHGVQRSREGRGYWVPTDADSQSSAAWVSTDDVAAKVRAMAARHVLVVADSCFSGMLLRDFVPEAEVDPGPDFREARKLSERRSRWVIASGGAEPVTDGGAEGMSVFAYFLRDSLIHAKDRYVVPDRLFPRLRQAVTASADQTPTQGRIPNSLQTDGQLVLLNRNACRNTLTVLVQKTAFEAEQDWMNSVVKGGHQDDAAFQAAVEAWIGRWSGSVVTACEEEVAVDIPRLQDALQARREFLRRPADELSSPAEVPPPAVKQRRWPRAAAIGGAVVTAGGVSLLAVTGAWWGRERNTYTYLDDGTIGAPDEPSAQTYRRMWTLQRIGVATTIVGVIPLSLGVGVGLGTTDTGAPALRLNRSF